MEAGWRRRAAATVHDSPAPIGETPEAVSTQSIIPLPPSARGRTNFERVMILLEFDPVDVKEYFSPEQHRHIRVDKYYRRFERIILVRYLKGEVADKDPLPFSWKFSA
jgi:hypothetical protein